MEIMQSDLGRKISAKEWDDFRVKAKVAMDIYEMRITAGMTQAALAALIGTKPSVISRLEDVEYRGHSLTMLEKIGRALGYDMDIQWHKTEDSTAIHRHA